MPSPTTSMPSPPPEIWRLIFRFATTSQAAYAIDYLPFQPVQEYQETNSSLEEEALRLQTCLALVLVSRSFRDVAVEFLYEDVKIYDARGLASFMSGLSRSAADASSAEGSSSYGSYVRRLEVPHRRSTFSSTDPHQHHSPFPTHPIPCDPSTPSLSDILLLCPRLQILVRPCLRLDAESIAFWASLVRTPVVAPLTHLMRLEWHESELDSRFYGFNNTLRLRELVSRAPNLRYLFLSSDRQNSLADLCLPSSLRTLRINRSHFHSTPPSSSASRKPLLKSRCHAPTLGSIPNFRNLVLHTTLPASLLSFVSAVGQHLRVLELAFAPQMIFSSNQMQRLLASCPVLEELVYALGAPEISPLPLDVPSSVKRVRLKINPDEWNPCKPVLRAQLEVLEGPSFPELREVILHDSSRWLMRREVGREAVERMVRRGWVVRFSSYEPW
ncbi:t-SNARE coiled-coil-like proteiny domain-containing protein [Favolaschia claudopus]|uniref:t-SNARE coiled-coil-like proteiny domain-containing protein n=1 Tax=Favolaschia claudopus TaxID=2862362 RepID=A0AAW0C9I3_9AGAR